MIIYTTGASLESVIKVFDLQMDVQYMGEEYKLALCVTLTIDQNTNEKSVAWESVYTKDEVLEYDVVKDAVDRFVNDWAKKCTEIYSN
jgi:hypothetical protein